MTMVDQHRGQLSWIGETHDTRALPDGTSEYVMPLTEWSARMSDTWVVQIHRFTGSTIDSQMIALAGSEDDARTRAQGAAGFLADAVGITYHLRSDQTGAAPEPNQIRGPKR
jgi:hypothetical protein